MTTYYVGAGGNDGNNGTTWATRKLTLNGAEDVPVAAGDTVYVGAGVYRETLTVDVSGGSGSPITYIADVTGENTDSVGGVVRVTKLQSNENTVDNGDIISASSKSYRTFRGFYLQGTPSTSFSGIRLTDCDNFIIEDCVILETAYGVFSQYTSDASYNNTIRRCYISAQRFFPIHIDGTVAVANSGDLVENCMLITGVSQGCRIDQCGGITFKNCSFPGGDDGIRMGVALGGGHTDILVYNSYFVGLSGTALRGTVAGEITEDYNAFFCNAADRTNVNVGANSTTDSAIMAPQILLDEYVIPCTTGALTQWTNLTAKTGTSMSSDDMYGLTRPTTDSKKSWGAVQFSDNERTTDLAHGGSVSLRMTDAALHQMFVPVSNVSTTIAVWVYREAEYTGTNPTMTIKQPGQADRTTTDAGAAGQWNQISDTFTPAATPPWIVVELSSLNETEDALYVGNYDVYWDDLTVS
jgi:hypothetical protein